MDLLSDSKFKAKITRFFNRDHSKETDKNEIILINNEFIKRTSDLKEEESKKWIKYDDMLKCIMMKVNIAQAQYEEESDIEDDDTDDNDSDQESNDDDNDDDSDEETDNDLDDDNIQQHRIKYKTVKSTAKNSNTNPDYSFVKYLPNFDGNFGDWKMFKIAIEKMLLNKTNIDQMMKMTIIKKLLTNEPNDMWKNFIVKQYTLERSWIELTRYYENSKRINIFIKSILIKMKSVQNKRDITGLKDILEKVIEFQNILNRLGAEYKAQSTILSQEIAIKFWPEEYEYLITRCTTLKKMIKRIELLYQDALLLNVHYQSKNKNDVPTERKINSIQFLKRPCNFCNRENHKTTDCSANINYNEKRKIINDRKLCSNCLIPGHLSYNCYKKNQITCNICKEYHPSSLHGFIFNFEDENIHSKENSKIIAQIVTIGKIDELDFLFDGYIADKRVKALLDTGAAISIMNKNIITNEEIYKATPILLKDFQNRSAGIVDECADILIQYQQGYLKIKVYLSNNIPINQLIVGRDQFAMFLKEGHKVLHTIFGEYDFEHKELIRSTTTTAINEIESKEKIKVQNEKDQTFNQEVLLEVTKNDLAENSLKSMNKNDNIKLANEEENIIKAELHFNGSENIDSLLIKNEQISKELINLKENFVNITSNYDNLQIKMHKLFNENKSNLNNIEKLQYKILLIEEKLKNEKQEKENIIKKSNLLESRVESLEKQLNEHQNENIKFENKNIQENIKLKLIKAFNIFNDLKLKKQLKEEQSENIVHNHVTEKMIEYIVSIALRSIRHEDFEEMKKYKVKKLKKKKERDKDFENKIKRKNFAPLIPWIGFGKEVFTMAKEYVVESMNYKRFVVKLQESRNHFEPAGEYCY